MKTFNFDSTQRETYKLSSYHHMLMSRELFINGRHVYIRQRDSYIDQEKFRLYKDSGPDSLATIDE